MHGSPEPLGVSLSEGGVNVAVFSANATAIAFCTFDADGETQTRRWVLPGKTGSVFHGFIPGVGAGANYALRAYGPFAPEAGHRFAPETVLIDPYALALGPHGLAVVVAPTEAAAILSIPWDQTVIYELHVRGFTKTHPGIPEAIRGTFAGLAHPVAIAHLQRLGVTSVELMPVATWTDERHLAPLGLSNYWGYNPVAFMVPDARLAPGGWDEVRMAVAALAEAGIETLLDVVFNHTGEGDALGPTLSWRGLDNASYYRLTPDNPAAYVNDAGTGNVLALDRPFPLRLVMDCLRTWRRLGGVNGFRFDLATVLGRRAEGFDPAAPLLAAIGQDPELRGLKLIAEPWDIGPGGYQLGRFPATWGEWNDRFRDDLRGFWAGDAVSLGTLAARLAGSQDLLPGHPVSRSVNFIVAHDGFTLADLTSYDAKQNLANGELGRDGSGHERSWNHGVNGPSSDPAVEEARRRDQRALIASLIVARGTPMLAMGMEQGHSQGGNNNAYAQDNAISWLNWAAADPQLVAFTQRLIAIRRDHIALRADQALTGTTAGDEVHADVAWRTADGDTLTAAQWDDALGESLVMALAARDPVGLDRVVVILHRGPNPTQATLPEPEDGYAWTLLADSADPDRTGPREDDVVWAQPRSVQILAQIAAPKRRPRGADDTVVARLAAAAGIAPQWWGVDGQGHAVSRQTQSVLLTAMGLPAETTHQALESLSRLADEHDRRALPFITTLSGAGDILVRSDPAVPALRCPVILQGEDGTTHRLRFKPAEGALHLCRDGRWVRRTSVAAPDLPMGRYTAFLEDQPETVGRLTVAPKTCHWPLSLHHGHRRFGLSVQLYSLRRAGDQGIGDFTTLGDLAQSAAAAGAAILAINPLHMLFADHRERASPYYPSDRRFLDPIYLDIGVDDPGGPGDIDYATVWARKSCHLRARFAALADAPGLDAFIAAGGESLRRFAVFQAGSEPGEIRYQAYLQWLCDTQLAEASRRAEGLAIGLCRDLAVGAAPGGSEASAAAHLLAHGVSIGAPPDPLGPDGQVWGLPPFNPHAVIGEGYAHFAGLLRANMRHAAALRIDHIMGLARQFWVPDGAEGVDGAYVDYPLQGLLGELALESQRNCCLVIGEDLGTVPEGLRERLAGAAILSYRVLPFERVSDSDSFKAAADYPPLAMACVATHDTPTLAGWWQGADITERQDLGLLNPDAAITDRLGRRADKLALAPDAPDLDAPLSDATAAGIHALIAATPCALAMAQAEDLAGELIAVNLPGTDAERPNWRRRIAVPIDTLLQTPLANAILSALRHGRG